VKKSQKEANKVSDRTPQGLPSQEEPEPDALRQPFGDSGLTGQGAQSALHHLVEQERKRADHPDGRAG
jgi:hypothetical protein